MITLQVKDKHLNQMSVLNKIWNMMFQLKIIIDLQVKKFCVVCFIHFVKNNKILLKMQIKKQYISILKL